MPPSLLRVSGLSPSLADQTGCRSRCPEVGFPQPQVAVMVRGRGACRLRCRAVGTRGQHFSFIFRTGPGKRPRWETDRSCFVQEVPYPDRCRGREDVCQRPEKPSPNIAFETPKGSPSRATRWVRGCPAPGPSAGTRVRPARLLPKDSVIEISKMLIQCL